MTRLPSNGERISVLHPRSGRLPSRSTFGARRVAPSSPATNGDERRPAEAVRPAGCAGEEPPTGFNWQQEPHRILEVCNRWRVHARWWEGDQAVWREYFKVTTDSGLLCLIYHDLQSGDWYLSRIYD